MMFWSKWEITDDSLEHNEYEDPGETLIPFYGTLYSLLCSPDLIQGIDPDKSDLLGRPTRRDPDALPPNNVFEAAGNVFYHFASALGHGNAVFGFKAGTLSGTFPV